MAVSNSNLCYVKYVLHLKLRVQLYEYYILRLQH